MTGDAPNYALLQACERNAIQAAAQNRDVIDVGHFQALLNPSDDLIWLNYAVPVAPIDDPQAIADDLKQLRRVFDRYRRKLRFEFSATLWPELPPLLEQAGLTLHARHPLMICTPGTLQPFAASGVTVRLLDATTPDDLLARALTIRDEGFGHTPAPPSAALVASFRALIQAGRDLHALAFYHDSPAAVGSMTPIEGIAELTGVATRPALRRHGAAAALSAALTAEHFRLGGTLAWLSASDAIAQAVYTKVGYRLVDERLTYIKWSRRDREQQKDLVS